MAACKDCIHYEVCKHCAQMLEEEGYEVEFDDTTEVEKRCEAFKLTADVVPKSEVAELLRLMFNDDCACNYNGNDEWLPEKCKFALTDCPMPQERLGCWMEFVEHGLAELKKKHQEGEPNG